MESMMSYKKPIWNIIFEDSKNEHRNYKYAAYDIIELLSYFNESGIKKIISIIRTEDEINFKA